LKVRFTGGEPLLREDFEELYLFARRLGLRLLICTNATLITRRLAELLASVPPLERIEVTVYGLKQGSYEAITRVPGSFGAARHGMDLLLDCKVPFVAKGVRFRSNKGETKALESWASTIPWMEKPPTGALFLDLRGRRDSDKKNRLIKGLRLSREEVIECLVVREGAYRREMKAFCSKFTGPQGENLFDCGSGRGGGCVDAYGRLQGCIMLRHPDTVYDLKRGNMKDALTEFFPKIRQMKAESPDYLDCCAHCFLKGLCEQCPARSWMEHGNLDNPVAYHCEMAHAQARFLGLLSEEEMAWEVTDWKERVRGFSLDP
jgi:radical SAM protein with 4Fe4S-binding SPASM domain